MRCSGRVQLLREEEERTLAKVTGEEPASLPPDDCRTSLPGCKTEGINYVLECGTCRDRGLKRQYWGESSRSTYQRGREHCREIRMGKLAHPMVLHFWEQHDGRQQPVLMRVTSKHLTALERQVRESINIEKCAKNEMECLNLKN